MTIIGNIIWLIFGGIILGFGWAVAGLIMCLTLIGIPWARSCFVISKFTFFPFGRVPISRRELTGENDLGTGSLGVLGNIIWIVLAGWWLALGHLFAAVLTFLTIIGIPFSIQHLKLARITLAPVGIAIVSKQKEAEVLRRYRQLRELGRDC